MNFPATHSLWMWIYFGTFGSVGLVLFTLIVVQWKKINALTKGYLRSAAKWSMFGYTFLFFAAWFACGIGGPPGNLFSADPAAQNLTAGIGAGVLSMFFTVPGWACVLVSMRKMVQVTQSE